MTYPLAIILALASFTVSAATVEWDWPYDDERVTRFVVKADNTEIARTSDVQTRSVSIDLVGGETITAYACSDTACSPPSNALWVPPGVSNIRITWGLQ